MIAVLKDRIGWCKVIEKRENFKRNATQRSCPFWPVFPRISECLKARTKEKCCTCDECDSCERRTTRYLKIPKKNANPSWNFRTAADAFLSDTRPDLPRVYRYARKVDFLSRLRSTPVEVDKQKLPWFYSPVCAISQLSWNGILQYVMNSPRTYFVTIYSPFHTKELLSLINMKRRIDKVHIHINTKIKMGEDVIVFIYVHYIHVH